MALGTLATLAVAASAATGISQAVQARKTRKANEAALRRQEDAAKAEAGLRNVLDDTGAEVDLGRSDNSDTSSARARKRRTQSRSATTSRVVGGISTSSRVGF